MTIVGLNEQHDASVAIVTDRALVRYCEAQKDNNLRYSALTPARLADAFAYLPESPDVVAIGGWFDRPGGYLGSGLSATNAQEVTIDGESVHWFTTSHERAHVLCAYAMSPYEQGQPCYVLIWEGLIGRFYEIDRDCNLRLIGEPVSEPGHRYALAFELAHQAYGDDSRGWSYDVAGKLMALAGVMPEPPDALDDEMVTRWLSTGFYNRSLTKGQLTDHRYYNVGHTDGSFRQFARRLSDRLFDRYYEVAKTKLTNGWPLLIAGGCGLNCGWNTRWRDSGLFEGVFVPPCPDDSGIALGVAADAQRHYYGSAKIRWDVYAGEPFHMDRDIPGDAFDEDVLDFSCLVDILLDDGIVAWVEGNYELGPRALGHRSLLAAPFHESVRERLNQIKQRENYRPVAPICLLDDAVSVFDCVHESPYMLYFQHVRSSRIPAVVHTDHTARIQTVTSERQPRLHDLLTAFKQRTGLGVLCNTSLNFPGRGFVNRASDLIRFVAEREVDAFVLEDRLFFRRGSAVCARHRRASAEHAINSGVTTWVLAVPSKN
jgi:predicted NodU family carbamoyl transferase